MRVRTGTYIFYDDEIGHKFSDALLEQQARGVQVNVIYDSVGALKTPKSFFERRRFSGKRSGGFPTC